MRKLFTFLCAALMSVGMYATTVVTITDSDFPGWGDSFTKDGVTVSAEMIDDMYGNISGPGSFSTTLGNFTKIEVNANYVNISGEGWSGNSEKMTWTGNASSVSFTGDINGDEEGLTLKFTIEPASTPEPEPAEVTVVFAANNKTVERTVTLPHTFKCDWNNGMDGPDELDIIIHELYNDYYYCNSNMNASGSDQVEVGTEEDPKNDYITIKGVFEGTATVTGDYFDWITGEEGAHNYSITISIKGDEPQGETITVTWNSYDLPSSGSSFTKDGVTLTCTIDESDLYGPGTFTTDLGNFTQIVVSAYDACYIDATGGWSGNTDQKTWTGNAASVSWGGAIYGFSSDVTIVFTIEPKGSATAVENIVLTEKAQKVVVDGMIYIVRDGKIFNVTGALVR